MGSEAAADRLNQLTDLVTPYAIRTAATLRVPDLIADGTCRLDDIAEACGADPQALGRLLRHLVHRDVFAEPSPGVFALTELGGLLRERRAGGHGAHLDLGGLGGRMDLAFTALPHAIRTGQPSYAAVHGRDLWADLDAQPELRAYFDELMLSQQRFTAPRVAELYPWAEVTKIVDVGGGSGGLLAELLRAHGHLRGTVVDRAEPVATAVRTFAELGLAERAEGVVGSFFEPLPGGADAYIVSRALTDWNDERATAILRRCAEAAGTAGRVLVVEMLPGEPLVPHRSPFDLTMLAIVGGRERGAADFEALGAAAGLRARRALRGGDGLVVFEFIYEV